MDARTGLTRGRMASIFQRYERYQKEAGRDIPAVVVERIG